MAQRRRIAVARQRRDAAAEDARERRAGAVAFVGMQRVDECRVLLGAVFEKYDVLLVPCVPGEAPKGLGGTGDPSMQAIWTALHTPAITLPTHRGPNNLPVGIQLVAQRYEDDHLLAAARWVWQKIGSPEMAGYHG